MYIKKTCLQKNPVLNMQEVMSLIIHLPQNRQTGAKHLGLKSDLSMKIDTQTRPVHPFL